MQTGSAEEFVRLRPPPVQTPRPTRLPAARAPYRTYRRTEAPAAPRSRFRDTRNARRYTDAVVERVCVQRLPLQVHRLSSNKTMVLNRCFEVT